MVSHFFTNFYFLLFPVFKKLLFKLEGFGEWSLTFLWVRLRWKRYESLP